MTADLETLVVAAYYYAGCCRFLGVAGRRR
jgi:hypothetical protein